MPSTLFDADHQESPCELIVKVLSDAGALGRSISLRPSPPATATARILPL